MDKQLDSTFVASIETKHTGGGIMCDFLKMTDGSLLVISDDVIALYSSEDDFDKGITMQSKDSPDHDNVILRY